MTGMISFQIILGLPFDIIYESILRLSVITFFWYHISLDVFWKLNFSIHFLIKDKVLPCKTSVINRMWLALLQLNRAQAFEIIHFASYWLWHSFYLNAHSIHILIKDEVQTCKKSIINGIWLAWFQLNCNQPFEFFAGLVQPKVSK